MTLIQPNKESSLLRNILICLTIGVAGAMCAVVMLYSQTVDLNHKVASQSLALQKIEAENADYKDEVFQFFSSDAAAAIVSERNLAQNKNPEYFEAGQQWTFASR